MLGGELEWDRGRVILAAALTDIHRIDEANHGVRSFGTNLRSLISEWCSSKSLSHLAGVRFVVAALSRLCLCSSNRTFSKASRYSILIGNTGDYSRFHETGTMVNRNSNDFSHLLYERLC